MRKPVEERFWKRGDKSPNEKGCWNWTGGKDRFGYGLIYYKGKRTVIPTHRLSFIIHNGEIPEGFFVLHACDNPACVNPAHLYPGTQLQNMREKAERKRWNWNGKAIKLNADQVRAIRLEYDSGNVTLKELGIKYKVTGQSISNIVRRKRWKNVL